MKQVVGEVVTGATFCSLAGISRSTFNRMVTSGMPVLSRPANKGGEYKIAVARALRWMASGAEAARRDNDRDFDEHRARLFREQADAQALKNEKLRAELLPAAEVAEAWKLAQARCREVLAEMVERAMPAVMSAAQGIDDLEQAEQAVRRVLVPLIDGALTTLVNTTDADLENGSLS